MEEKDLHTLIDSLLQEPEEKAWLKYKTNM